MIMHKKPYLSKMIAVHVELNEEIVIQQNVQSKALSESH